MSATGWNIPGEEIYTYTPSARPDATYILVKVSKEEFEAWCREGNNAPDFLFEVFREGKRKHIRKAFRDAIDDMIDVEEAW